MYMHEARVKTTCQMAETDSVQCSSSEGSAPHSLFFWGGGYVPLTGHQMLGPRLRWGFSSPNCLILHGNLCNAVFHLQCTVSK